MAGSLLVQWLSWNAYLISIQPDSEFNPDKLPDAPEYQSESAWLVTPEAPALSVVTPDSLQTAPRADAAADVFFVHPTTYFGKSNWNASIDDFAANEFLENLVVPGQISVFNACCRIYAPRYRQATFFAFLKGTPSGRRALESAYGDIRAAFENYMDEVNDGRPFILASHSQGTLHAIRLLEEVIAHSDYRERLVAAYLPGFALPRDKLSSTLDWLPVCEVPDDTRCLIAWDTFGESGGPQHRSDKGEHYYIDEDGGHWEPRAGKNATCVNPIAWSPGLAKADREFHNGSTYVLLPGLGSLSSHPTLAPLAKKDISARCGKDGYLYISEPSSPVYDIGKLPDEWYHNHDISLFYKNIRDNAVDRVNAYLNLE